MDERMMILKMLEEGKISSEEASKLIEALDDIEYQEESIFKSKVMDEASISDDRSTKDNNKSKESFEEKIENFSKKIEEKFGDDFAKKMEEKGEKIGEKMGKFGEEIADGATSLADRLADMVENMIDKGTFVNIFGSGERIEETLEKDIKGLSNLHLEFEGVNGKISINPWSKDNILVKAVCHVKKNRLNENQNIYNMIQDGNRISFKPGFTDGLGTKLEINIPSKDYDKLTLKSSNGKIEAIDLNSKEIKCETTNASISLSNITGELLNLSTKNAKTVLNNINSNSIVSNTSNASIYLDNVKSKDITLVTRNGKVLTKSVNSNTLDIITSNASINLFEDTLSRDIKCQTSNGFIKANDLKKDYLRYLELKTSNASIDISLDDYSGEFDFDLKTSMGHINLDIPNLLFDKFDQKQLGSKQIIAHTKDFTKDNGIAIMAKTSNGSIKIG